MNVLKGMIVTFAFFCCVIFVATSLSFFSNLSTSANTNVHGNGTFVKGGCGACVSKPSHSALLNSEEIDELKQRIDRIEEIIESNTSFTVPGILGESLNGRQDY